VTVSDEITEPEKVDLETPDLAAANRAAFEQQFPGVLADGVIDAERLKELLDVEVVGAADDRERYGLMWAGKKEAVRSLQDVGRGTLIPEIEASSDFDGAQNAVIEGDSLEVLKLLQKAYNDRIKLIYIDPPYNTGNEFIYEDDFSDGLHAYLEYSGQLDDSGDRVSASADKAGRKHSRWLSLMYPRLLLARNLLRQDGAICVSIDANEDFHLRLLLDEVFGPENFVGQLVVIRAEGGGMAEQVVQGHDLLLVYARNRSKFAPLRRPKDFRGEIVQSRGVEYWIEEDWLRKEFGKYGTCHYEEVLEYKGQAALDEIDEKLATGEYRLIKKKTGLHVVGRLRPTATDGSKFYSVVKHLSRDGKRRLEELGMDGWFDFPKPPSLIKSLVLGATFENRSADDIFLDFFAGSGTTADAVLQQNAEDGGSRRFILVTLPEPIDPESPAGRAGCRTLADVTRRRVAASSSACGVGEGGSVRHYRLSRSNFRDAIDDPEELFDLRASTLDAGEHTMEHIAQEVLLKEGVPLHAAWERHKAAAATVIISEGVAVVMSLELTNEIADAALALEPKVVVFLEDGFAGADAVKANTFTNAKNANIVMKTV
jgi:adenine-specific DNA-methyltransferase